MIPAVWLCIEVGHVADTVPWYQDHMEDTLGPDDFSRPDKDDNRKSFAESLKTTVGSGARAFQARLGRSKKTLIRNLPIVDQ